MGREAIGRAFRTWPGGHVARLTSADFSLNLRSPKSNGRMNQAFVLCGDSSHTARISYRRVRPTDRDYAPAAPGGESTGWLRCVQSSFPNRGDQLMIYEGK